MDSCRNKSMENLHDGLLPSQACATMLDNAPCHAEMPLDVHLFVVRCSIGCGN